MKSMSDRDMELLLTTPPDRILAYFGRSTAHRGYMYYSPFRREASPSMRVTMDRNTGRWIWADYGGSPPKGKKADGGGCLDMVRRLSGVSTDREALDILAVIRGTPLSLEPESLKRKETLPTGIVIDGVDDTFSSKSLIRYATIQRRIPLPLLNRYCREVSYHTKADPSRHFTAIGFRNNGGGYALRGTSRRSKISTLSDVTTLDPSGGHSPGAEPSSFRCYLFEGFMDFLSWMAWRGVGEPGADVCVLNSVSNLSLAEGWLLAHGVIRCFLDNDPAGRAAYDRVCALCAGRDIRDSSSAYRGSKDLNEAYVAAQTGNRHKQQPPGCRKDIRQPLQ
jgi:hypothetical protein